MSTDPEQVEVLRPVLSPPFVPIPGNSSGHTRSALSAFGHDRLHSGYVLDLDQGGVRDGRVLLLKNEREEWELPGGRIEPDAEPVLSHKQ